MQVEDHVVVIAITDSLSVLAFSGRCFFSCDSCAERVRHLIPGFRGLGYQYCRDERMRCLHTREFSHECDRNPQVIHCSRLTRMTELNGLT